MRWPLDHLFHSNHFQLKDLRRLQKFGSDHFALYTELVLLHKDPPNIPGLPANDADEEFASEKLDHHDVDIKDVPFHETEK